MRMIKKRIISILRTLKNLPNIEQDIVNSRKDMVEIRKDMVEIRKVMVEIRKDMEEQELRTAGSQALLFNQQQHLEIMIKELIKSRVNKE